MRKSEEPKISFTMVSFSGNKAAFKSFMGSMISDYLNSDKLHNIPQDKSVEKVEITENAK
ncbi:MAG: hypothetical protein NC299_15055 [Lachnospiraceae bacterium]|nr:hypothetical protein [Ruminococcus sp.]MCM1276654.1 hypothetical protein [Lachnospiraceae bacterium]